MPALPRLADAARFVPYHEVRRRPHIVVDGPFGEGAVLGLSHWPDGHVPDDLAADTSAEIVAHYLDAAPDGPAIGIVTNNHFDEDGLLAAWLLLERVPPGELRDSAIDAAAAGDFHVWRDPDAARAALTLMAMAERTTTPFPDVLRALNRAGGHDPAGAITLALLPHVGDVLADPGRYRRLWESEWAAVERDIERIESGRATLTEIPGEDLAVVTSDAPLHRLAVHPRLDAMRVVHVAGDGHMWLEHRYETWVRYVSRPLPPRIDLTPVAERLSARDGGPGTWRFEGVAHPVARLVCVDGSGAHVPSSLTAEQLVAEILQGKSAPR